jgi:hypothetical protein
MSDKGFRGFTDCYAVQTANTSLLKAPLAKHLIEGHKYEFSLKSND